MSQLALAYKLQVTINSFLPAVKDECSSPEIRSLEWRTRRWGRSNDVSVDLNLQASHQRGYADK